MSSGMYVKLDGKDTLIEDAYLLAEDVPYASSAICATVADMSDDAYNIADTAEKSKEFIKYNPLYVRGVYADPQQTEYYYNNEELPFCKKDSIHCFFPNYVRNNSAATWGKRALMCPTYIEDGDDPGYVTPNVWYVKYGSFNGRTGIFILNDYNYTGAITNEWELLVADTRYLFIAACGGGGAGGPCFAWWASILGNDASAGTGGGGGATCFVCVDLTETGTLRLQVGRGGRVAPYDPDKMWNTPINSTFKPQSASPTTITIVVEDNSPVEYPCEIHCGAGHYGFCMNSDSGTSGYDYSAGGTVEVDEDVEHGWEFPHILFYTSSGGRGGDANRTTNGDPPYLDRCRGNPASTINLSAIQEINDFVVNGGSSYTLATLDNVKSCAGGGGGCVLGGQFGCGGRGGAGSSQSNEADISWCVDGKDGIIILSW